MRKHCLGITLTCLLGFSPFAFSTTLEAPAEAVIGTTVDVSWADAPADFYDSIYVVTPDQPDEARGIHSSSIQNAKNPVGLKMPEFPGEYELRYWNNVDKQIEARRLITVIDIESSLSAAESAVIGSKVEVTWQAPGNTYDVIALYEKGVADDAKAKASSSITGKANPITVRLPEQPGEFELRYVTTKQKRVLARRPITVLDFESSLSAPDSAIIGSNIEVTWQAPGNTYDVVALYEQGAADNAKAVASSSITSKANPIAVRMPEQPGKFELRYVTTQEKRILARRLITIEDATATLDAPEQVDIGATIEVTWEGPGNQYDLIALHEAGAADDAKAVAGNSITSKRNPIVFRVPETAGDFELRYQTSKTKRILARRPITIGGVVTSLDAPETATADTPLLVSWEGPGNNYDRIALYTADAADDAKAIRTGAILSGKNPVLVNLPEGEGDYELRYVTAQGGTILARRALRIEPAGRLTVVFERSNEISSGQDGNQGSGAVELILDASGSMLQRENGVRRIEIARQVLDELVREHLSDDRQFALRVFGHKEVDKCRTDLEIPLGPLDRSAAAARIASVNAMNLAKTPIADSLAKVSSDLSGASGPKTIILITDGEETCEGDPAAVIASLRSQGLDVQVSVIGFAIDDIELKSDFESWAQLGGGSYFDARSADELIQSLRTVISGPFRVFNAAGDVVGQGVIGGAEIVLPAGIYRVETVSTQPLVIEGVVIKPRELTEAAF